MTSQDLDVYFDALVDYDVATKDEIILVLKINGTKLETYESILFTRTGCRSFDQWLEMDDHVDLTVYGIVEEEEEDDE